MARILITSGPTRQYLDPVRYLTNASSGRMGRALAQAAVDLGHDVIIVSGPVSIEYPSRCEVIPVNTTAEMLEAAKAAYRHCDGLIGVAAPCDYRPVKVSESKIQKTGEPLVMHLLETPDIVATLAAEKNHRWAVGFALETEDHRLRALAKLERKRCDLMVVNNASAISAVDTEVEIVAPDGTVLCQLSGSKEQVSEGIIDVIDERLIEPLDEME